MPLPGPHPTRPRLASVLSFPVPRLAPPGRRPPPCLPATRHSAPCKSAPHRRAPAGLASVLWVVLRDSTRAPTGSLAGLGPTPGKGVRVLPCRMTPFVEARGSCLRSQRQPPDRVGVSVAFLSGLSKPTGREATQRRHYANRRGTFGVHEPQESITPAHPSTRSFTHPFVHSFPGTRGRRRTCVLCPGPWAPGWSRVTTAVRAP